ncbi:MAG: NAD(P)H-dependent oxidoreductase [Deltaproteobacteria bacterium]|nr:NAD(P)H-dependent oxidoreductase [Deltaproteobacteria bacterium]
MRLMFINGSPRGTKSNTDRLMEHFIRGFLETEGNACRTEYLVKYRQNLQTLTEKFSAAENVIIGFPLYIDAMPGSVKEFLEVLAPFEGKINLPALGFVIQCGFPETSHTRFAARYCEKFSRRIGCRFLGAILKGGCEGLDIQPNFLTDKYFSLFNMIGVSFGKTGKFDEELLTKLARPEHLSAQNMAQIIPYINQALWDARMEKNGVLDRSFDRPFTS